MYYSYFRKIKALREKAQESDIERLFVLTTVSSHWFLEQGFIEKTIDDLPVSKQDQYNTNRNSKVFMLSL